MAMTALVLASSAYSAYSQQQAGKDQQAIANRNAEMSDAQATQAKLQGDQEINAIRRRTRQLIGRQTAAYAAQGVDVGSGAPVDVAVDTGLSGLQDEQTARTNAALAAWGFKTQASNERFQGAMLRKQGNSAATATILDGLGRGYQSYDSSNGLHAPPSSTPATTRRAPAGQSPSDYPRR
jgi:hypothetical protein